MNKETFYLPIKSVNLAHYISKGCICPAKYIRNRNEDIQNKIEDGLLISKNPFTSETNCAIEIALDPDVEIPASIDNNFSVLNVPIPVSRIRKVLFEDERQLTNTLFNINNGAGFISEQIAEVKSDGVKFDLPSITDRINIINHDNFSEKLEKFDRILGGFAMMRLGGEEFQNYPLNYFSALSLLNSLIGEEIVNQSIQTTTNFDWAILGTNKFVALHDAIYSKITERKLDEFSKADNTSIIRSNGKIQLDRVSPNTTIYLIAILASYGDGTRQNLDNFFSDFLGNKFPPHRREGISLIFGINKGYTAFRNRYKTANFDAIVKFKLDSQLDFYTIESIYQYVFNNKRDNYTFAYIDSWCQKASDPISIEGYDTYQVLDRTVVLKKKENQHYSEFFQRSFQDTSKNSIYEKIIAEVNSWLPPFANKHTTAGFDYFKKLLEPALESYSREFFNRTKEYFQNSFKQENLDKEKELTAIKKAISEQETLIDKLKVEIAEIKNREKRVSFDNQDANPSSTFADSGSGKSTTLFDSTASEIRTASRRDELLALSLKELKVLAEKMGVGELNGLRTKNLLIAAIIRKESTE